MRILEILQDHLYSTLFSFILIEELGIPLPVPGDAIMIFLGIEFSQGQVNFLWVLILSLIATWIGATILFLFSRKVGRPFILRHEKILKYIHITPSDVDLLEHYMSNHGTWILIIARIIPGLRTLSTITAGLLNVSYKQFILATTIGTALWTCGFFILGAFLGRRYTDGIENFFNNKLLLLLLFIAGLSLWILLFKLLIPALKRHRNVKLRDLLGETHQ